MRSRSSVRRSCKCLLGLAVGLTCSGWQRVEAQVYSVTITGNPDLGNVVGAPTGNTVFSIAPGSGSVTRLSGTANRLSSSNVTPVLVTIGCTGGNNPNKCQNSVVDVTITASGSPTGKALGLTALTAVQGPSPMTDFTVTGSGTTITVSGKGIPQGGARDFYLGMNFTLQGNDAAAVSGNASAAFTVSSPDESASGIVRAFVLRPISLSKDADLRFGYITRPTAGSTLITLDALDPACPRSAVGGNGAVLGSASGCATYTIGGEPGGAYSISTPTTFDMTRSGGADIVTVTLNKSSSVGVLTGSGTLRVGGSFTAGSGTPAGAYVGSFVVTVQYN